MKTREQKVAQMIASDMEDIIQAIGSRLTDRGIFSRIHHCLLEYGQYHCVCRTHTRGSRLARQGQGYCS